MYSGISRILSSIGRLRMPGRAIAGDAMPSATINRHDRGEREARFIRPSCSYSGPADRSVSRVRKTGFLLYQGLRYPVNLAFRFLEPSGSSWKGNAKAGIRERLVRHIVDRRVGVLASAGLRDLELGLPPFLKNEKDHDDFSPLTMAGFRRSGSSRRRWPCGEAPNGGAAHQRRADILLGVVRTPPVEPLVEIQVVRFLGHADPREPGRGEEVDDPAAGEAPGMRSVGARSSRSWWPARSGSGSVRWSHTTSTPPGRNSSTCRPTKAEGSSTWWSTYREIAPSNGPSDSSETSKTEACTNLARSPKDSHRFRARSIISRERSTPTTRKPEPSRAAATSPGPHPASRTRPPGGRPASRTSRSSAAGSLCTGARSNFGACESNASANCRSWSFILNRASIGMGPGVLGCHLPVEGRPFGTWNSGPMRPSAVPCRYSSPQVCKTEDAPILLSTAVVVPCPKTMVQLAQLQMKHTHRARRLHRPNPGLKRVTAGATAGVSVRLTDFSR